MSKVLVYMQYGRGWQTPSGVKFSYDHPYQLVPEEEVYSLVQDGRFRTAKTEELKAYYAVKDG